MVTRDYDDDNKGEKRCFDLFATLLSTFGNDDETRAKRERNMLMIHTITSAATNTFSLGNKRKIDDDHDECKNQENTASSSSYSSSLVEYKRRRVVEESDEPIRAQPVREIKPPVKEPVRRESVVTPGWVLELMRRFKGDEAKMIVEKVMTKTDLTPSQGRLLMPFNQMVTMDFLTKPELKILDEHKNGDVEKGVDVILLNRSGEQRWNLNMRIWEMRSSFNYALCSGWNQVVRNNNLQKNNTITLWSFHSLDGTLYFAFDPPAQAPALVPFNPAASSSSVAPVVISQDPFVCVETNRRLFPFPKRSRTPRVCVGIIRRDSSYLEGLDLNKTPPEEECMEMDPLEAVQETHIRSTSQESITETSLVSFTETSQESVIETFNLELRL